MLVSVLFLMIRRPPRSTLDRSSAASDVYKRQVFYQYLGIVPPPAVTAVTPDVGPTSGGTVVTISGLSLIHISEPTRPY